MREAAEIRRYLSTAPRVKLLEGATPLHRLGRLEPAGGPPLFLKRDDITSVGLGGNKVRKLEFLVADALRSGAEVLITGGAIQSNHVRQTAAVAAKFGLRCKALLTKPKGLLPASYETSGNILVSRLLGCETVSLAPGVDCDAAIEESAREMRRQGAAVYAVPVGGSNAIGALGYVSASLELCGDLREREIDPNEVSIILASGSGGTHAGLAFGLSYLAPGATVIGASVGASEEQQALKIGQIVRKIEAHLEIKGVPPRIQVYDAERGPGYGHPSETTWNAIHEFARREGVILDPVYSGKSAAAALSMLNAGAFADRAAVVLMHLGGTPGLFGYSEWVMGV
jgi:D-cysteine desulfhydrase